MVIEVEWQEKIEVLMSIFILNFNFDIFNLGWQPDYTVYRKIGWNQELWYQTYSRATHRKMNNSNTQHDATRNTQHATKQQQQ